MHKINPEFRISKFERKHRRNKKKLLQFAGVFMLLAVFGGSFFFYATHDKWSFEGLDNELVQVEIDGTGEESETDQEVSKIILPTIINLPGDPLIINLGSGSGSSSRVRKLEVPTKIPAKYNIPGSVNSLKDSLLSSSQQFMAALPSTPEDFRFFQLQRSSQQSDKNTNPLESLLVEKVGGNDGVEGDQKTVNHGFDESGGWGDALDENDTKVPLFEKTKIENTTNLAHARPENERYQTSVDRFVKIISKRSLRDVLIENGFSESEATKSEQFAKKKFRIINLQQGHLVAMRGIKQRSDALQLLAAQISLYKGETYLGTIARSDDDNLVVGSDPWLKTDLFSISEQQSSKTNKKRFRRLDAIFSMGIRNSVPQGVIGEAIMLLSQGNDLNRFAEKNDVFTLLYTTSARNSKFGHVIYTSINSSDGKLDCFVLSSTDSASPICGSADADQSVETVNGMIIPVSGVLTSKFGPRKHPVLKKVRMHKGVDWAAPMGTPIRAAFGGTISYAGDGKGYGNIVKIAHGSARETRYAHMSRFSPKAKKGQKVAAGDIIGFVGTSGLSSGPHLHFELRQGGEPLNPMGYATSVVSSSPVRNDSSAVAKLTNKIIRVESGGNARAKNPLSSATGLGQFISSTWIRMMKTYRPDLYRSLSRRQLLNLRFDPGISREMVSNLAREGESYLRRRGHTITAGRLYLAHFLGMDGAHVVLSSANGSSLRAVLGPSVIKANPFLTGKNVAYVKEWAERKMRVRGTRSKRNRRRNESKTVAHKIKTKKIKRANKKFIEYKKFVTEVLLKRV